MTSKTFFNRYVPLFLSVVGLLATAFILFVVKSEPKEADAGWYNSGGTWGYRKEITIDRTRLSTAATSTFSNFPFLFSVTDTDLKTVTNSGRVGKDDGSDIVFTSSDGTTKLSHEIEKYASTTGETVAWVRIPTLSAAGDTTLFIYFGNAAASDQEEATTTWDSFYQGVWHLGTSNYNDSTANANNGTNSGASDITGYIDGGQDFELSQSDYVQVATSTSLEIATPLTIQVVAQLEALLTTFATLVNRQFGIAGGEAYTLGLDASERLDFFINGCSLGDSLTLVPGNWYFITVTANSSNIFAYSNGAQVNSGAGCSSSADANPVIIGASENGATSAKDQFWDGVLDEVRISNVVRSADWVKTEYNNVVSPSNFFSYSAAGVENRSAGTAGVKTRGGDSASTPAIKVRGGVKFK